MNLPQLRRECEAIPDWWEISCPVLERLAAAVLGPRPGGWVRRGAERAIIARVKYGAVAATLPAELAALTQGARGILGAGGGPAALRAAAWYHVRLENIHPLHDGNGRVGRIAMAGQIYQACQMPPATFERRLTSRQAEYAAAFAVGTPAEIHRRLLALLGQVAQIEITDAPLATGPGLEPLHRSPDRVLPITGSNRNRSIALSGPRPEKGSRLES